MFRRQWLLWAYLALTVVFIGFFVGPVVIKTTTLGIVVGTLVVTVGAALIAFFPAYLLAGVLANIMPAPPAVRVMAQLSSYILAAMPSIILGVIGFLVFCNLLGLGWSMLSAMLTLLLLLYPTMVTAFLQVLAPLRERYLQHAKACGVGPLEFQFRLMLKMNRKQLFEVFVLGWATSLGDTAAVMLTCGALTGFPSSLLDSVRLINYHIYILAMDTPGGMIEAKSLSLLLLLALVSILVLPRVALVVYQKRTARSAQGWA